MLSKTFNCLNIYLCCTWRRWQHFLVTSKVEGQWPIPNLKLLGVLHIKPLPESRNRTHSESHFLNLLTQDWKCYKAVRKNSPKKVQCQFIIKGSEEGSLLHSEGSGGLISIADNYFSTESIFGKNCILEYLYTSCILDLFNVWFSAVSVLSGKHIKFYSWLRLPDNLTFLTFPFTLVALLYLTFLPLNPLFDANAPVGEQGSSWRTQFQGN